MAMKAMLLLVPIIVVGWFLLPKEAREAAADISTGSRFGSAATRLISVEYAYSIFQSSPIYGAGVGLRKIYDATNLIMLTLAETGIAGLVTFGGIFVVLLFMAWKAQRRLPKKDPAFSLLVIGIALMFGKATHGLVDHYWSRGVIPVWAGAGFVAFAYVEAMKRPLLSKGARKTR
jgi:O-antigen ligase